MFKRVLVTGGTGTFGRAFVRRCLKDGCDRVVCFSRDEWKQALMEDDFADDPALRMFLGDVRDYNRLKQAMQGVDLVVAAAALKRIDAAAYNPTEATMTNVHGVENTIRAAVDCGVKQVIVISSDKAVAPTTHYGATKALAETTAVQANAWAFPQGTAVSAVRYGNVLGSRGSVVQTWKRQAARGQALTITDRRMTRFIMTIEQAVDLVLWTAAHMQGGEIVVPDLPSTTVGDLAEAVVPGHPTIEIGLRDGSEKMAESLLCDDEPRRTLVRDGYFVVQPAQRNWSSEQWVGTPLSPAAAYRSDLNERWLNADALRQLLLTTEALA